MSHVILGATGHIGGVAARTLLDAGESVIAVVRDAEKAASLRDAGAELAVVDLHDSDALRAVFERGRRALLLNPPAAPDTDTDAEELRTGAAIAAAVAGSGLEKVLVVSTYGAQPGEGIGDLSTLYAFEERVAESGVPAAINRGAFYYTNFDGLLEPAKQGTLPSMYPADQQLAMVAPADLGRAAVRRLTSGIDDVGVRYVEGPARRTFAEVAAAFAAALGHAVTLDVIPRDRWEATFRDQGFSEPAARSFAKMFAVSVDGGFEMPDDPERGRVTMEDYVRGLVAGDIVT